MKNNVLIFGLALAGTMLQAQTIPSDNDSLKTQQLEEVFVQSTRAGANTPMAYSTVKKAALQKVNLGQDLPILLNLTPSMVTTSDAGAGVGYTGMRIRGSDASRINVTINGVPLNDSESQGVYWVNMPDFASTVSSIQIQRGVGTSTNGAGAFGATVNLATNNPSKEAFVEINNSYGSFNTRKHNLILNSGLLNDHWAFEGRLSQISSDGYIDRAWSDLKSYYLSGGFYGEKTIVKALVFGGQEETYQAWYGTPEAKLINNSVEIQGVIDYGGEYGTQGQIDNLINSGRTFNFYTYDNEIDHYQQDHYQLHFSHQFNSNWSLTSALHYTYGRGYYEQYKADDDFANYGMSNITYLTDQLFSNGIDENDNFINDEFGQELLNDDIEFLFNPVTDVNGDSIRNIQGDVLLNAIAQTSKGDFIRRRWLDNHFGGFTFSIDYSGEKLTTTLGGGYNKYDGDHFGEVIWAQFARTSNIRDRYYDNVGNKEDMNIYWKTNYQVLDRLNLFVDLQLRQVNYSTEGIDSDLQDINITTDFTFFNPKFGASLQLNPSSSVYGSFAIGNREPVRNDFIDSPASPEHETLYDLEVGYKRTTENLQLGANIYAMNYKNQLVLTGELNDVGNSVRTNVDKSYRRGIEIEVGVNPLTNLSWVANATFSQNKIEEFTEILYDYISYPATPVTNTYSNTDISFSPNLIIGSTITYSPFKNFEIQWMSKYVGKQFLDNTSNDDRSIDDYFIDDVRLGYNFSTKYIKNIGVALMVNNVFDQEYSSNGYTWGYLYDGWQYQQNNYYPQAGTNFLASLSLKF